MTSSQSIFSLVIQEITSHDFNPLRQRSVLLLGAGSLGAAVSDILVNLGIGKLILFDYDREEIAREEIAKTKRSFFSTNHQGQCTRTMSSRLTALVTRLKSIDPNFKLERHNFDITAFYNLKTFADRIKYGSLSDGKVDIVFVCTNDFGSHMATNTACSEANQPWISCICTPMSGQMRLYESGNNSSFDANSTSVSFNCPDKAILPSTVSFMAGIITQTALKFLLKFGTIQNSLDYDGFNDTLKAVESETNKDATNAKSQQNQETPPIVITDEQQETNPNMIPRRKRQLIIINDSSENYPRPKAVTYTNPQNISKRPTAILFRHKLRCVRMAALCDIEKIKNIKNPKINVTATILRRNNEDIIYPACTVNKCKMGVKRLNDELKYNCRKCGIIPKCRPAYRVKLSIADFSGSMEVVLFETAATKLFGQSAEKLHELMENNREAYKKAIDAFLLKTYDFEIRYRVEKFGNNLKKTLVVDNCFPVEPKRYLENLKNAIDKLNIS